MPITALSGVRISWLMLARNRLLARAAASASDLARSSASAWWWLSVTSVTVPRKPLVEPSVSRLFTARPTTQVSVPSGRRKR